MAQRYLRLGCSLIGRPVAHGAIIIVGLVWISTFYPIGSPGAEFGSAWEIAHNVQLPPSENPQVL